MPGRKKPLRVRRVTGALTGWERWFLSLKAGDLVEWQPGMARRAVAFRTVLEGPADDPSGGTYVIFPILRRSWCVRPTTVYGIDSARGKIGPVPTRHKSIRRLATAPECEALWKAGFRKQSLQDEVRKKTAFARRLKREPGRALRRAAKLVSRPGPMNTL